MACSAENTIIMSATIDISLNSKICDCESVLNYANIAIKCLNLYPANHETTRMAVETLWTHLQKYFDRHGHLDISIESSRLLLDNEPVAPSSLSLQSLALQLYRLKLDRLLIKDTADKDQLLDMLMIFCMAPGDVFRAGGVRELLLEKEAAAIGVSQASLKLNYEIDPENESDEYVAEKQAVLIAQKALQSDFAITDSERLAIKNNLEQSPRQLAAFLETLGTQESIGEPEILKMALPKIRAILSSELIEEQGFLYQNLAEALSLLDQPLKNKLAGQLFSGLAQNNILTGLETADPLLKANGLLRDQQNKKNESSIASDADKLAASAMSVSPQALSRLEAEIAQLNKTEVSSCALAVLSDVLFAGTDPADITLVSHAIQRLLLSAFNSGNIDGAADALTIISNEAAKRISEPDNHSILKEIIRDAGKMDKIESLLSRLERQPDVSQEQITRYLLPLGNIGIRALLDILAVEDRQGRRRIVCQLLTACGKNNIAGIGDKILDHRWYLVRNVVLILGRIGDRGVIPYLQKAALHPDARVRMEAAKALSRAGHSAFPIIQRLLKDNDANIRLEAIRSLSRLSYPKAADVFIEIINERDILGRRLDVKLEAIRALGLAKTKKSIGYLKKLARRSSGFIHPARARLRAAAIRALLSKEAIHAS